MRPAAAAPLLGHPEGPNPELWPPSSARAIDEFGYDGSYTTVYPIKVNQQRHVVQEIVEFGRRPTAWGSNAAARRSCRRCSASHEPHEHLIVCNGYKDEEFIRLALMGQQLGHQVFIVVEQLDELDELLKVADEMGVVPTLGVRIKLATEGSGRWAKSGGERSKFGLAAAGAHAAAGPAGQLGRQELAQAGPLPSRQPDHRHPVRQGRAGGDRAVLRRDPADGVRLTHVDVGGGLGVDYDGSRTTRSASMNYTMREYASDVVYTLGDDLPGAGVPMPHLISESGRALTAHHSLLLVNVIDVEAQIEPVPPVARRRLPPRSWSRWHENLDALTPDRVDGGVPRRDLRQGAGPASTSRAALFTLREQADAEQLYLCTLNAIAQMIGEERVGYPEIRAHIEATLVDRYFCNFSVFQSLPDNWAIDQLFPIMPIHRLDEAPDPARHHPGHHLRLRRRDRPVRRRSEGQALASSCIPTATASRTSSAFS